ncbi:MAG TPA: hypothetical protein VM433_10075 [Mycobacteriales bacterium]|nr:hypothetical protein [Mycobacteriales bacterium]
MRSRLGRLARRSVPGLMARLDRARTRKHEPGRIAHLEERDAHREERAAQLEERLSSLSAELTRLDRDLHASRAEIARLDHDLDESRALNRRAGELLMLVTTRLGDRARADS